MLGAQNLLGTLVSTGLGGLRPQPGFDAAAPQGSAFTRSSGGGLGGVASLVMLGTLAYKAYQSYGAGRPAAPVPTPAPAAAGEPDHDEAQTLIRAMIAGASADGRIDDKEEAQIHQALDKSGASDEDRRFVAAEVRSPATVDELAKAAKDPAMASHIYAASLLGVGEHSGVNQSFLRYLSARLGLEPDAIAALHREVGVPPLP